MRLLNTTTLQLEPNKCNRYAILSHQWRDSEVLFHDLQSLEHAVRPYTLGVDKIMRCCERARNDGYDHTWIDTCCIDKTSSAELSESINSMYAWYKDCDVCYAYLDDVNGDEDPEAYDSSFRESRWFRRGWTLQELIAPKWVTFFASDWNIIGTRQSLAHVIEQITSIDHHSLWQLPIQTSIAQRMSWASHRETTVAEDIAYSLMGLFEVNMPTLYGEGGERAFLRLQEEIMKVSNDQSIFAWSWPSYAERIDSARTDGGLLATRPALFGYVPTIAEISYTRFASEWRIPNPTPEYIVSKLGVHLRLPLINTTDCEGELLPRVTQLMRNSDEFGNTKVAVLACEATDSSLDTPPSDVQWSAVGVLVKLKESTEDHYVRVSPELILLSDLKALKWTPSDFILCRQPPLTYTARNLKVEHRPFRIRIDPNALYASGFLLRGYAGIENLETRYDGHLLGYLCQPESGFLCSSPLHCATAVFENPSTEEAFAIVLGMDRVAALGQPKLWSQYCGWSDILVIKEPLQSPQASAVCDTPAKEVGADGVAESRQPPWDGWSNVVVVIRNPFQSTQADTSRDALITESGRRVAQAVLEGYQNPGSERYSIDRAMNRMHCLDMVTRPLGERRLVKLEMKRDVGHYKLQVRVRVVDISERQFLCAKGYSGDWSKPNWMPGQGFRYYEHSYDLVVRNATTDVPPKLPDRADAEYGRPADIAVYLPSEVREHVKNQVSTNDLRSLEDCRELAIFNPIHENGMDPSTQDPDVLRENELAGVTDEGEKRSGKLSKDSRPSSLCCYLEQIREWHPLI